VRHIRVGVGDEARTSGPRARIVADDVHAGLYIPPDFERRRLDGDCPVTQLLIDATRPGIDMRLRVVASATLPAAAVRRLAGRAHAE
jgi:hypothetical protein